MKNFPEGQGNTHIECFCIFSLGWALRSGIINPGPIANVHWSSEYSRLAESCPTGSNLLMTDHCRPKELRIVYEVAKDLWDHQLQPLTGHHLVARPWHLVPHPIFFFNTFRDGDSTNSLDSSFQWIPVWQSVLRNYFWKEEPA